MKSEIRVLAGLLLGLAALSVVQNLSLNNQIEEEPEEEEEEEIDYEILTPEKTQENGKD